MDLSSTEEKRQLGISLMAMNMAFAEAAKNGEKVNFLKIVFKAANLKTQLEQLPEPELKKLLTNGNNSGTE